MHSEVEMWNNNDLPLGTAFMDIPDGQVCKALEMHRTYFNGRMINVEETKNGGKNSAVGNSLDQFPNCIYDCLEKERLYKSHEKTSQRT